MAKDRICNDCENNNNGWCKARKTNKGLKDLVECEFKKDNKINKIEEFIKQKEFELQFESGSDSKSFCEGKIEGLKIALAILNN